MRTINISISDKEYKRLGLASTQYTYQQWVDLLSKKLANKRLQRSVELAEEYGLSVMNMEEITAEVNAVREDAKNRN